MENIIVFRVILNEEDVRIMVPEQSVPTIIVDERTTNIVSKDTGIVYASFPTGTPVFFSYHKNSK